MSVRPITRVDDTYAHPCGCVTEGGIRPEDVTEACGRFLCPLLPVRGEADRAGLLKVGVKVRGK